MIELAPSVHGYSLYLRAVSSFGLTGSILECPSDPLSDLEFTRLNNAVRSHKLTGFFWSAISSGAFPSTDAQREWTEESHLRVLSGLLLLDDLLIDVVSILQEAGVPVRVLKGSAVAHLDYPDPSMRTFADLDLLVPTSAFDQAVALLERRRCRRAFPEPRPGFNRRFGKGATLRTPYGLEIDLHRTFSMGPFGQRQALDELWEGSETFRVAGRDIPALSIECRFLHACYHAVLGDRYPQLVPLRDVAQILLSGRVDWPRAQFLMHKSQCEAVVARAVRLAWSEYGIADLLAASAWSDAFVESAQAAADISVYGPSSCEATRSFAAVRALPSLAEKISYLAALVLPQETYVNDRYPSRRARLVRGVGDVLQARSSR